MDLDLDKLRAIESLLKYDVLISDDFLVARLRDAGLPQVAYALQTALRLR